MNNHGLTKNKPLKYLRTLQQLYSIYLSNKRGGGIEITDNDILTEINKSAGVIFEHGSTQIVGETCRVCNLLESKNFEGKIR